MNIMRLSAFLLVWLMVSSPLVADSVYTWTDENGVRHFSNTGLPDEAQDAVEHFEEIPSGPTPELNELSGDESVRENPPEEEDVETSEEEAAAAGGKQQMDARLAARVEKERQRLEAEIKRIEGLAIGKSFTPGMKDAQIAPLKEQLALLEADPERYFRMKRQGAFQSTAASGSEGGTPSAKGPLSESLEPIEGASSYGKTTDNSAAAQPEATDEQQSDQTSPDEKKSGRAQVSEPGASLRLPDE